MSMSTTRPSADDIYDLVSRMYRFVRDTNTGDRFAVHRRTNIAVPLSRSGEFRNTASHLTHDGLGRVPSSAAVSEALDAMLGEADAGEGLDIHLRMADVGGDAWLDGLGDDLKVIRIHDGTWDVVDRRGRDVPVFRRSATMLPLIDPVPADAGDLSGMWEVINVREPYRSLLTAYIVHCLIEESTAFPILSFTAEQGSGKTMGMRLVHELIDPSADMGGAMPASEREFAVGAMGSRLLTYDNLSSLRRSQCNMLCRAATGGTFKHRKLYRDSEAGVLPLSRPIMLTAISLGSVSPDLAERMVRIRLERIDPHRRLTGRQVGRLWSEMRSRVFGAFLTLAAKVRQVIDSGELSDEGKPRMADFGMTLDALDHVTGSHSLSDYRTQQDDLAIEAVSDEPVLLALQTLRERGRFKQPWRDPSSVILSKLKGFFQSVDLDTWKSPPQSSSDMTRAINRCAPSLRKLGWTIESEKGTGQLSGTRIWTIALTSTDCGVRSDEDKTPLEVPEDTTPPLRYRRRPGQSQRPIP